MDFKLTGFFIPSTLAYMYYRSVLYRSHDIRMDPVQNKPDPFQLSFFIGRRKVDILSET
jgi:hypothetical protein